jgi:hypothetical protein
MLSGLSWMKRLAKMNRKNKKTRNPSDLQIQALKRCHRDYGNNDIKLGIGKCIVIFTCSGLILLISNVVVTCPDSIPNKLVYKVIFKNLFLKSTKLADPLSLSLSFKNSLSIGQ